MRVDGKRVRVPPDVDAADRLRASGAGRKTAADSGSERCGTADAAPRERSAPASSSPGPRCCRAIIADRNGPWLSERLRERGVELAHIDRRRRPAGRPARGAATSSPREGVDLIITSGGLGPTADDLTAEVVADFAGRALALDAALEERIWAILDAAARRAGATSTRSDAGRQPQAGAGAARRDGARAGRHRARARRAAREDGGPTVLVLPGPAARAAADVGRRRSTHRPLRGAAGGAGRAGAADPAAVRRPGVRDRRARCATLEAAASRSTRSRSRPACAAASSRSRRSSRPPPRRPTTRFEAALRERHGDALFSARRLDDRRAGRRRCCAGRHDRRRRVVHRRADGGPADRPRGLLGVRARRASSSTPTRPRSALADVPAALIERHGAVSPEVAVALADGARARFGADLGHRHHRHRRPGRRHAGEAGRHGLPQRGRAAAGARTARSISRAGGRTSATARPRSPCTCCARCCSRGERAPSRRARSPGARSRRAHSLRGGRSPPRWSLPQRSSLPPVPRAVRRGEHPSVRGARSARGARTALAAFRGRGGGARGLAPGGGRGAARHARLPRPPPGGGRRGGRPRSSPACPLRRRRCVRRRAAPAATPRTRPARGAGGRRGRCWRRSRPPRAPASRPPALHPRDAGRSARTSPSPGCEPARAAPQRGTRRPDPIDLLRRGGDALSARACPAGASYEPLATKPLV